MKKLFGVMILIMCFSLVGCGGEKETKKKEPKQTKNQKDNVTVIKNDESGITLGVNEIPYGEMKYNDETIGMKRIGFYRIGDAEYGYDLYSVIELDFSKLSDDSVYELMKENDGDLDKIRILPFAVCTEHKFYDDENNESWNCEMEVLHYEYDTKHALIITYNPQTSISCDFSDSSIYVSAYIEQDETYIGKNVLDETEEMNVENGYQWMFGSEEKENTKNGRVFKLEIKDEMPSDITDKVLEGIENKKTELEKEKEEYEDYLDE